MTHVIIVDPGTEKCKDFFNFLSASPNLTTRYWSDNVGLKDAMEIGISDEDYGWYIDDLENARSIERIDGPDGEKNSQVRIEFDRISESTPAVMEALMRTTNRIGHPHIKSAYYMNQDGDFLVVSKGKEPVPYEMD